MTYIFMPTYKSKGYLPYNKDMKVPVSIQGTSANSIAPKSTNGFPKMRLLKDTVSRSIARAEKTKATDVNIRTRRKPETQPSSIRPLPSKTDQIKDRTRTPAMPQDMPMPLKPIQVVAESEYRARVLLALGSLEVLELLLQLRKKVLAVGHLVAHVSSRAPSTTTPLRDRIALDLMIRRRLICNRLLIPPL